MTFPMHHPSLAKVLLAYPQTIFATLVWLRHERDALALADLTTDLALRARILCTVAQEWHLRADAKKQDILSLLTQAQDCLSSLPGHARIDAIRKDLVIELAMWQQWSTAQELTGAISTDWCQKEAQWTIVNQMLEAGLWEEALKVAPSIDDWMLFSYCEACARLHAWELAEEALQSMKGAGRKIDALCMLARELAVAAETSRAEAFWRQAVQIACEGAESIFTLAALGEDLARAHQWELAEVILSTLLSPPPGSKDAEDEPGRQTYDHSNTLWVPVLRARVLATLAGEYTKVQWWERVGTRWEEAQALALSCQSSWHQTVALGDLTVRFAEAHQWQHALETWQLAETCWLEARAHKEAAYEIEERDRRLGVLIALCHHLVRAHQWQQAWKLCQRIEDISMKIRLGSEIATELDLLQQKADALIVWTQTRELALTIQPLTYDLSDLALAFEKVQRWEKADVIWKVLVNNTFEADQDDVYLRTINCGLLALTMAQRQRRDEALLLLKESMKAAVSLWEQRPGSKELIYREL